MLNGPGHTPVDSSAVRGWLRLLCLSLTVWEPVECAVVAAGAFNAVSVRGLPVALVLAARLLGALLCVAAGRALFDRRPLGPSMATAGLVLSASIRIFAYLTPYFPSNRLPGQTPIYVFVTLAYYGAWCVYLRRSSRVAALFT
jgi:hypothetical protein